MEKNNRQIDWGDINQFKDEIDIQAEWLDLRKKLERKKRNRKFFLMFLSVASSVLLLVFLNSNTDHQVNTKNNNGKETGLVRKEFCPENTVISFATNKAKKANLKIESSLNAYNNKLIKSRSKNQLNNLIPTVLLGQQSDNLTKINSNQQQLNNLIPTELLGQQFNNLSNLSQALELIQESIVMIPIMIEFPVFHNSTKQIIQAPEIKNTRLEIVQKPSRLTTINFLINVGMFNSNITTNNQELITYIAKRNSIEKPIYELGIASNLEFRLHKKFSLIGELNYRVQTSHIKNSETISYFEERDNVILEINRRPDGTEDLVRGKAQVEISKTVYDDFYNSQHTLSVPVLLKYKLNNGIQNGLSLAAGVSLASYSWANGYQPDQNQLTNYLPLNQNIKHFKGLDAWMLRAEYGFVLSKTIGISLFSQYHSDLTNSLSTDEIQQKNSSFSGGITINKFL